MRLKAVAKCVGGYEQWASPNPSLVQIEVFSYMAKKWVQKGDNPRFIYPLSGRSDSVFLGYSMHSCRPQRAACGLHAKCRQL